MGNILFKRKISDEILRYVFTDEILVLHGARQTGKTCILYWLRDYLTEQGKTVHYVDLEDSRLLAVLNRGQDEFLSYLKEQGFDHRQFSGQGQDRLFVFVDEIQYLTDPSSFLKLMADHYRSVKLVVSGSSSFDIKSKFKDSLVGRTVDFGIYNLTFEEFLIFKGIGINTEDVTTKFTLDELKGLFRQFTLQGGYPKIALTNETDKKERYLQQILDTYVRKDIRDLANVRDIDKFDKLLEALAAQSGQVLNLSELSNTCAIAKQTVENYLSILEQTYVIKRLRPYHKNIRSEISKAPKIFFYDSGLMQMLWLKSFSTQILGNIFETAVFAEFVKRYGSGSLFYWRTQRGQEIDFILKKGQAVVPYEAKVHLTKGITSSMKYFCKRYHCGEYYYIALEGQGDRGHVLFPWML